MTRFGWIVLGAIVAALVCAGAAAFIFFQEPTVAPQAAMETSTSAAAVDPSELAIYTSGQYGFSFFYPADATLTDVFGATSTDDLPWRTGATATGTLIARVQTQSGEVRIGESAASKEVAACGDAAPAEDDLGKQTFGSTTWAAFGFDSIGTDNEEHITSYRTVHDDACYALETFTPIAEDGAAPEASSTAFSLASIVQSFSFAGT